MISVDSSSNRSTTIGIAVAVLVGAGVSWWWLGGTSGSADAPEQSASAASVASTAMPSPEQPVIVPERRVPEGREAEVGVRLAPLPDEAASSVDEGLRRVLTARGGGDKEIERVTAFLDFQRQFERFQDISQDPSKAALKGPLARKLFDMLPERVKRAELSQPEGLLLCSILLETLEPNENRRSDRLSECSDALTAVAPKTDTEQQAHEVDCHLEFRRRENALVAEYQASERRDPVKLARDLEEARKAIYESPTCGHS
jgi:hypothetical protein